MVSDTSSARSEPDPFADELPRYNDLETSGLVYHLSRNSRSTDDNSDNEGSPFSFAPDIPPVTPPSTPRHRSDTPPVVPPAEPRRRSGKNIWADPGLFTQKPPTSDDIERIPLISQLAAVPDDVFDSNHEEPDSTSEYGLTGSATNLLSQARTAIARVFRRKRVHLTRIFAPITEKLSDFANFLQAPLGPPGTRRNPKPSNLGLYPKHPLYEEKLNREMDALYVEIPVKDFKKQFMHGVRDMPKDKLVQVVNHSELKKLAKEHGSVETHMYPILVSLSVIVATILRLTPTAVRIMELCRGACRCAIQVHRCLLVV